MSLLILTMWQKLICGCALCLAIANLVGNIACCLINDLYFQILSFHVVKFAIVGDDNEFFHLL
jgi:hypothetical protein